MFPHQGKCIFWERTKSFSLLWCPVLTFHLLTRVLQKGTVNYEEKPSKWLLLGIGTETGEEVRVRE